jgi:hypothetical protein
MWSVVMAYTIVITVAFSGAEMTRGSSESAKTSIVPLLSKFSDFFFEKEKQEDLIDFLFIYLFIYLSISL